MASKSDKEIIGMYKNGTTMTEIRKKIHCRFDKVKQTLTDNKIKLRQRRRCVSEEDQRAIIALYKEGNSLHKTAKRVGCDASTVRSILVRAGVNRRPVSHNRPVANAKHDFFDQIETEQQAYWLGFFSADGCIHKNQLNLTLSARDVEHVKAFASAIECPNKIRMFTATGYKKTRAAQFTVSDRYLAASLAAHGVTPRKSLTIRPAHIRQKLAKHYWRGLLDGNGYVCVSHGRTRAGLPRKQFVLGLIGTKHIVNGFKKFLLSNDISVKAKVRPHASVFQIAVRDSIATAAFRLLYDGATVFLPRKKHYFQKGAA